MQDLEFEHDRLGQNTRDNTTCKGCKKTITELTKSKAIDWYDVLDDNLGYVAYCGRCYGKIKKQRDTIEHIKKCFSIENYRNNKGF